MYSKLTELGSEDSDSENIFNKETGTGTLKRSKWSNIDIEINYSQPDPDSLPRIHKSHSSPCPNDPYASGSVLKLKFSKIVPSEARTVFHTLDSPETDTDLPENTALSVDSRTYPYPPAPHSRIMSVISFPSRNLLKTLVKLSIKLTLRLWKLASTFALMIFLASWFYGGILPFFVVGVAFCSIAYHMTDNLIYQPDTPPESRILIPVPAQFGIPFEAVYIHTSDRVRLHGYLLRAERPEPPSAIIPPTILHFHGNAGNIGHRLESAKELWSKLGCNVLLLEYRGYGLSEGIPSEQGFYTDAKSAFQYIENREDLDGSKIILFGRSLGGAVAIDLASRTDFRDRIYALILENTFTSIQELAKHLFQMRIIEFVPRLCYKSKYESKKKISSVVCPTLFISGTKDELIPPAMMAELYARSTAFVKVLSKIPGGSHNDTWTFKSYIPAVSGFLEQVKNTRSTVQSKFGSENVV